MEVEQINNSLDNVIPDDIEVALMRGGTKRKRRLTARVLEA